MPHLSEILLFKKSGGVSTPPLFVTVAHHGRYAAVPGLFAGRFTVLLDGRAALPLFAGRLAVLL